MINEALIRLLSNAKNPLIEAIKSYKECIETDPSDVTDTNYVGARAFSDGIDVLFSNGQVLEHLPENYHITHAYEEGLFREILMVKIVTSNAKKGNIDTAELKAIENTQYTDQDILALYMYGALKYSHIMMSLNVDHEDNDFKKSKNFHYVVPIIRDGHFISLYFRLTGDTVLVKYLDSLGSEIEDIDQYEKAIIDACSMIERFKSKSVDIIEEKSEQIQTEIPPIHCAFYCTILSLIEACHQEHKTGSVEFFRKIDPATIRAELIVQNNEWKNQRSQKNEHSDDDSVEIIEPPKQKTKKRQRESEPLVFEPRMTRSKTAQSASTPGVSAKAAPRKKGPQKR